MSNFAEFFLDFLIEMPDRQALGIGLLDGTFFQGDGAEIELRCPDFRPNPTNQIGLIHCISIEGDAMLNAAGDIHATDSLCGCDESGRIHCRAER